MSSLFANVEEKMKKPKPFTLGEREGFRVASEEICKKHDNTLLKIRLI